MVLILDGKSEHVAHAWRKIGVYGGKKSDLWPHSIESNALNRSNNSDYVRSVYTAYIREISLSVSHSHILSMFSFLSVCS